jgi:hypothetical protein
MEKRLLLLLLLLLLPLQSSCDRPELWIVSRKAEPFDNRLSSIQITNDSIIYASTAAVVSFLRISSI